jgi:hypothetical protein
MEQEAIAALALEMELDPQGYDIMDVDKILRAIGYECLHFEGTYAYSRPGYAPITFRDDVRYVPAAQVVFVAQRVRLHLERGE